MPAPNSLLHWLELAADSYGADLPVRSTVSFGASTAAVPPTPPGAAPAASPPQAAPRAAPPSAARPVVAPADSTPRAAAALTEPTEDPQAALAALAAEVGTCTSCKLAETRTQAVFGEGNPRAKVMFVGEAPGFHEDRKGRPFVGPAGQLLDRIIQNAMGLRREDVYIANVNKCRPPENRDPHPDEVAACLAHLQAQVRILQPAVLVALGRVAAHNLLSTTQAMRRLRGRTLNYAGIPVIATWHPAYLLRNPAAKADTWEDIKRVNRLLGRPEVPKQ